MPVRRIPKQRNFFVAFSSLNSEKQRFESRPDVFYFRFSPLSNWFVTDTITNTLTPGIFFGWNFYAQYLIEVF